MWRVDAAHPLLSTVDYASLQPVIMGRCEKEWLWMIVTIPGLSGITPICFQPLGRCLETA
jgi:hypothetical protein